MNLEVLWVNNNNLESINGLNSNVRMQVLHAEVSWPVNVNNIHLWFSFCKHVSDSTQATMTHIITNNFFAVCAAVLLNYFNLIFSCLVDVYAHMHGCLVLWFLQGSQRDT